MHPIKRAQSFALQLNNEILGQAKSNSKNVNNASKQNQSYNRCGTFSDYPECSEFNINDQSKSSQCSNILCSPQNQTQFIGLHRKCCSVCNTMKSTTKKSFPMPQQALQTPTFSEKYKLNSNLKHQQSLIDQNTQLKSYRQSEDSERLGSSSSNCFSINLIKHSLDNDNQLRDQLNEYAMSSREKHNIAEKLKENSNYRKNIYRNLLNSTYNSKYEAQEIDINNELNNCNSNNVSESNDVASVIEDYQNNSHETSQNKVNPDNLTQFQLTASNDVFDIQISIKSKQKQKIRQDIIEKLVELYNFCL